MLGHLIASIFLLKQSVFLLESLDSLRLSVLYLLLLSVLEDLAAGSRLSWWRQFLISQRGLIANLSCWVIRSILFFS